MKTIQQYNPKAILLLGATAIKSLLGKYWTEELGLVSRWIGWKIPLYDLNCWAIPAHHPSFILRERGKEAEKVLSLTFSRNLKSAFDCGELPFQNDYAKMQILDSSNIAAEILQEMRQAGRPIAFDYETNMLKPDGPNSRIICCAVSDGERTIAFPWIGPAVFEMGELLKSKAQKIAANLKFEDRWTRKEFGWGVKNWRWDTMQAAHILDNRGGVTGVKFQAFVRLGKLPYDTEVKKYLRADSSREKNRIDEIPMPKLLRYCGTDALVEYDLAMLQMQELGYTDAIDAAGCL